jgi:hypothetical protein
MTGIIHICCGLGQAADMANWRISPGCEKRRNQKKIEEIGRKRKNRRLTSWELARAGKEGGV